ncbi:MAG: hypothetical protein H8E19_13515 [Deltaproteobacteria bacterium]|uniref:Guanylate cyclase domain-containing protein n=1 Tax=Candidatus Desulfacyla euxinica TaxID=2841693 RepID=A0A8J6T9A8_9DELT|nr:hypothetical protein [Candidatus Desulfacyla euxinica]
MEGLWLEPMIGMAVPLGSALLIGGLLLRYNRENRNPLEWSVVDRCLLLIALYCFVGGVSNFIIGIASSMYFDRSPWVNWPFVQSYYKINRAIGTPLILLAFIGLWLRRRSPQNRAFAHIVIQYNAIHMSLACYAFGPVTHPGPFLLAMALGALNFLLFEPYLSMPWLGTFTVLTVGSTIATLAGLIPYSPLYLSSPFTGGEINTFHFIGTMAFVIMVFLLMLFLISYIFARWRDREAKVAEMTALLKKMFGRYLSTEVMTSLIENPSALELGGERREVTIMMTDLRGFTALSERLQPEQVVQMLNVYFEVMVEVVFKYNGNINEIIGDALLIIFGAPQEMPDRAQRAIACAIDMQNALAEVNNENRIQGLPELEMGIGLNETEVIVGNIGSSKRSKYAVVGSGVNMASRIESYTVGGQILISQSVLSEAGDILRIDAQREVLPKGAQAPLTIYEVGGISGRYNLAIEERDPAMVHITRQIPLRYKVLEGKSVRGKGLEGSIVRLSEKSALIVLDEPLEPLTNLKMNLGDIGDKLSVKDFYGKVIERSKDERLAHVVRFTSVPPEVDAYFQSHRQHVAIQT